MGPTAELAPESSILKLDDNEQKLIVKINFKQFYHVEI